MEILCSFFSNGIDSLQGVHIESIIVELSFLFYLFFIDEFLAVFFRIQRISWDRKQGWS